jgi:hypothetical protein
MVIFNQVVQFWRYYKTYKLCIHLQIVNKNYCGEKQWI